MTTLKFNEYRILQTTLEDLDEDTNLHEAMLGNHKFESVMVDNRHKGTIYGGDNAISTIKDMMAWDPLWSRFGDFTDELIGGQFKLTGTDQVVYVPVPTLNKPLFVAILKAFRADFMNPATQRSTFMCNHAESKRMRMKEVFYHIFEGRGLVSPEGWPYGIEFRGEFLDKWIEKVSEKVSHPQDFMEDLVKKYV